MYFIEQIMVVAVQEFIFKEVLCLLVGKATVTFSASQLEILSFSPKLVISLEPIVNVL